ncbi:MAG: dihydroneopterin aldolase, partial [Tetrasphaera sp.]|nr:dihydroneopterin aldolase [Tetrasphaera sp.]
MRDVIEVLGIRATGFHGVFEHEKRDGQEFVVDVSLELDLRPAGESDDLAETVNYGEVAQLVVRRIEG